MGREEAIKWAKENIFNKEWQSVFIFVVDYIFDLANNENEEPLELKDVSKFYEYIKSTWIECLEYTNGDYGKAGKLLITVYINKVFNINVKFLRNYARLYKRTLPLVIDTYITGNYVVEKDDESPNAIVSSQSRYDIPGGIANQYVKQINVKSN